MSIITLNLDVTKISKELLYKGKKGTYCDLLLMENKDGTDQYGNDGFAVQGVSKERREAGERGPIVGNWKYLADAKGGGQRKSSGPARDYQIRQGGGKSRYSQEEAANAKAAMDSEDEIPF